MKVFDCQQGSTEWLRLRMGRPTASCFDRILTPTGKPSSQVDAYCNELLGEMMLGRPLDGPKMPWMERGSALEAEARAYYEFDKDCTVQQVGFCTTDDERIGASPDGLVGEKGLVELKAPLIHRHISYLLSDKGVDKEYAIQVQGQMFVTGREFCDVVSYFPGLPEAIVRVERDEEWMKLLALHLNDFCNLLDARREKLAQRGWLADQREELEADWLGVSDADVTELLAGRTA